MLLILMGNILCYGIKSMRLIIRKRLDLQFLNQVMQEDGGHPWADFLRNE